MGHFNEYSQRRIERVNKILQRVLPRPNTAPKQLHQAMNYVVMNGGKRFRPLLVYASGEAFGVPLSLLDIPAVAVELIHAYSLVHDDLPAMDDDDVRRGKPSCHIAFDEGTAILCGDALQSLAYEVLSADDSGALSDKQRLEMIKTLAIASGSVGMAGGQALDLSSSGKQISLSELENIHHLKTGALIKASLSLGALAAEAPNLVQFKSLLRFADNIGLAFQIQDDLLDLTQGEHDDNAEPSYPKLVGKAQTIEKIQTLHQNALAALDCFDECAKPLRMLTQELLNREN